MRTAGYVLQVRTRYDHADVFLALVCTARASVQEQPLVQQQGVDGCNDGQAPQLPAHVEQRLRFAELLLHDSMSVNVIHGQRGMH